MKRFVLVLLCLLMLASSALATNRVADKANLFSPSDLSTISQLCDTISEQYDIDCVVATTNDSRGMSAGMYAADLVDYNGFKKDNVILVIAMDQRKYVAVTTGSCEYTLSDDRLEEIYDAMESSMKNGRYASAVKTALNRIERYLQMGPDKAALPHHGEGVTERVGKAAVYAVPVALIIGWIIAAVQKGKMNTMRRQEQAVNYTDGVRLNVSRDIYLYTTTVRRRIEQKSSSGGGGGFTGSSGTHHGGGGSGRSF